MSDGLGIELADRLRLVQSREDGAEEREMNCIGLRGR